MEKFKGQKIRCVDEYQEMNYEVWWEDEYRMKKDFRPTRQYRKWLKAEAEKAKKDYLMVLRAKLEYQMKTYGQVDEIDFQEFVTKSQLWG